MTRRILLSILCLLAPLLSTACSEAGPAQGPVVMAAASMQEALTEAADDWAERGNPRAILSFAGTGALARQVLAGAPADLFVSADEEWMDRLEKGGTIVPQSRAVMAGNGLVLVVPADSDAAILLELPATLGEAIGDSRLAMADPEAVPAGRYGKAALEALDLWDGVSGRITNSENVRAALALVERGEAPVGLVYSSDAAASEKVRIAAVFPPDSHAPIHYPLALLKTSANPGAGGFRDFLLSAEGQQILIRHGFTSVLPGVTP